MGNVPMVAGSRVRSAVPSWVFVGIGAAAVVLYAFAPEQLMIMFLIIPVASIVAIIVGARRNQVPGQRRPWYAMAGAWGCFFGAAVLRIVVPGATATPPGPAALIPDILVVPGYALFAFGLLDMLRRRQAAEDRPALSDAILVGLAAALAEWAFFLAPTLGSATLPTWPRLVAAAFPIVDVFLVFLVSRLMMADGVRQPALWMVAATTTMMLTVDLIYVLGEENSDLNTRPWLLAFDICSFAGYLMLAGAALHPTMRTLTEAQQVITRSIGALRIAGIAAVVIAPTILSYLLPASDALNVVIRIVLTSLLAISIVTRIVRSHESQALAETAARHRSTHDSLTDLPNRELLSDTIRQWGDRAISDGNEISLVFLDLDRFKQVNDMWGHRVGDELLCAVADRLSAMVRETDLVCRIGGDEFVVALASRSHDQMATSLAERVVKEFSHPFDLSIGEVIVTTSVGVARSTGAADALELIRDADTAMYQAKSSGRSTYAMFDTALREKTTNRVGLEQALRGALGRGELTVHYQPIISLEADELEGFEALMRWSHPRLGTVSPLDFIPIAEETGLIVAAGAWMLNESLDQLARWQRDRPADLPPLHVSVNISPRQLRDDAFEDVVQQALTRTGLDSSALWLEITESVMIEEPEVALAILNRQAKAGITICIDDFGTGYASLAYVRNLPARIVKVDKSFVDGIGKNAGDEEIMLTVLAMARALNRQVVAEGVETVEQRDWLRSHECDLVQGYLYGAPRPATAQVAWQERYLRPLVATPAPTR